MAEPTISILVIEDELQMRRLLRAMLGGHVYRVTEAATGEDGLHAASIARPDVILLDLGLPDVDGLEVTRRLREWTTTPVIVLSARVQEEDKVRALDAGADDYLAKPFGAGELLARIRVALRHAAHATQGPEPPEFQVGQLRVDFPARRTFVGAREVHLTPTEWRLLALLVRHSGKVLTHRQLLGEVWGPAYVEHTHYVRVYMGQLRQKLEDQPARPRYLITEPGVGYRLRVD